MPRPLGRPPYNDLTQGGAPPWWALMTIEALIIWILALALCELAYAASVASLLGGAGVIILTLCAWLIRLDLDLLATLLAATYGSVLVCLSLVQTYLEGFPGTPAAPGRQRGALLSTMGLAAVLLSAPAGGGVGALDGALFVDLVAGQGDWLEQVISAFHLFFYKVAALEAVLLNLFLLLALVASLSLLNLLGEASPSRGGAAVRGASRVRLIRSFRRAVRRKNSSTVRASKR